VSLPGAEHIALSDAVWLMKERVSTGDADPDHAIAAIRDYLADFLASSLGSPAPASPLGRPKPAYPGAVVASGAQGMCSPK
jgi:hypothetical protein